MSTVERGDRLNATLADLGEFLAKARRLVAKGKAAYDADETLQLAAEAILHRLGEAVVRLPESYRDAHPDVEWRKIRGMRNIVAHDYGRIDPELLWVALAKEMPRLRKQLGL